MNRSSSEGGISAQVSTGSELWITYCQRWGESAAQLFVDSDCKLTLRPGEDVCPISQTVMTDPVIAVDGAVYQRKCIEKWFDHRRLQRKPITSPATGSELQSGFLLPLCALQRLLEAYLMHRESPSPDASFQQAAEALQRELLQEQAEAHLQINAELESMKRILSELQSKARADEALSQSLRTDNDRLASQISIVREAEAAQEASCQTLQAENEKLSKRLRILKMEADAAQDVSLNLAEQVAAFQDHKGLTDKKTELQRLGGERAVALASLAWYVAETARLSSRVQELENPRISPGLTSTPPSSHDGENVTQMFENIDDSIRWSTKMKLHRSSSLP